MVPHSPVEYPKVPPPPWPETKDNSQVTLSWSKAEQVEFASKAKFYFQQYASGRMVSQCINFVLVAKCITEGEVWEQDHKMQKLEHLNKFSREAWMVKPGW